MPARPIVTALFFTVLAVASLHTQSTVHAQATVTDLNEAGWKAVQNGDGDRGSVLFARALALRPRDPVLLLGAGASAHLQGKPQEAIVRLQQALQFDPKLTTAAQLLGQIAYDQGQVDLAIQTYEQALKYAPANAEIARQLEMWRRDAKVHENFQEVRYDRFKVMFEGHEEQLLAVQVSAILSRAFWRVSERIGEYPSDTIVAVLYTEKQFRDTTRAPEWSGGLYDGRIRVPTGGATQNPSLFEAVLAHELTHAVVAHIARRGVPVWLHEGLAQYFEGADPQAARRRMKASGRSIPLIRFEGTFTNLNAADATVAYDESLLAVSVIMDRPGFGWGPLLHALADGQPFARAIDSFGFSYADLEAPFTR
jgi:tetratricopeptide (TPR) repeat protein